jgi:hypothetical protein
MLIRSFGIIKTLRRTSTSGTDIRFLSRCAKSKKKLNVGWRNNDRRRKEKRRGLRRKRVM